MDKFFEIEQRLKALEKKVKELEGIIKGSNKGDVESFKYGGIENLSQKTGIAPEKLKYVFDINMKESKLTVLISPGKGTPEKTRNATFLVLLGYKYILNKEEVPSGEIKRNLVTLEIPIENFSRYIKKVLGRFIQKRGKPRSPTTSYRLTSLGDAKAINILKNSVNKILEEIDSGI